MIENVIHALIASVAAFSTVYVVTPILIKYLHKKNSTVPDCHKKEKPMIVRPGGPALIMGILASEAVLYGFFSNPAILAIMLTSFFAFLVGYTDDKKVMGGWFKPLALAASAAPILLLGVYDVFLTFPLFGDVHIPLLYVGIVVIMISITGNTINSIDIFNGVVSGFMVISGFTLSAAIFIVESFQVIPNYEIAIASLPLGFVALAFYKYHVFPSKIFPGDSGTLTLGAMYGTLAIVGNVEVIAAIALLPAIINSFLFLSSTKKVVEHRKIKARPVYMTDDFKLAATTDMRAPVTLARIILSYGPLSEKQITRIIFKLGIFCASFAILSAFLMGVSL